MAGWGLSLRILDLSQHFHYPFTKNQIARLFVEEAAILALGLLLCGELYGAAILSAESGRGVPLAKSGVQNIIHIMCWPACPLGGCI